MRKNKNKTVKNSKENKIEEVWTDDRFDINGSYIGTGTLEDMPVQDADDL